MSKRTWQWVIGSLGVLVLLGLCGLSSYFVIADQGYGQGARPADSAVAANGPRDISSRTVDPTPLTVEEVFPGKEIVVDADDAPYPILKTQASEDCALVADGEIRELLLSLGCSQFVRATVLSPPETFVATAGIVNLADAAGASSAHEKIKPIVSSEKGRFLGMPAGRNTDSIEARTAQVGWHVRGHYLIYCVVAKVDGGKISSEDPFARQILFDMVEVYLRGKVLDRRVTATADPAASTDAASSD
ncbi:hypothetical protein [Micromonospora sp. HM5-17]|jgi:hypothetical protein|uniref:hypothetical protein n=1 Tax=Micromonospora sp. HM5-17 TaxID=2487710 RepID=UPI000F496A3A|nr:hypothetical protein [Micromonospora sp. HM5-17]ROT34188.1 hypothetical protein EF879_04915 [Micromonospora sp. HM5-17]